jgi:general secretion pathway protein L
MACNESGEVVQAPRRGTLAEAAAQAGSRKPVGLLPASDVVTLDAELPARAGAKLLQAVPYALADQVAEDIDDLHFAIGARAADGRTPVAVVSRAVMQAIDDACVAAGLSLQSLHAESALIAPPTGQVLVALDGEEMLVCRPAARAVSLPSRTLAESLALALDGVATGSLGLLVLASPADWQVHGPALEALSSQFAGFKAQLLPQGPLPWLAQGLVAAAPINLLQGRFAPRRAAGDDGWRRWRLAAALGGVLVVLTAAGDLWRAGRLAAAERSVDAALADAIRPLVPNPVGAREARRQVEAQLAAVRGGASAQGDFLPALAALAAARGASPETELKALGYRSGSFEVRLKARDAASLERISAALREGGWATDLLGGTGTGEAYEGRLRISAAGGAGSGS